MERNNLSPPKDCRWRWWWPLQTPPRGEKGLSAFLVPTYLPGYAVDRVEEKLGQKASDTRALTLYNLAKVMEGESSTT